MLKYGVNKQMATEQEILEALKKAREQRAEGGSFPDRIKWDEPKIVAGTVKSFSTFDSKYGESRAMVVEKRDGVEVSVIVTSPTALAGQMDRLSPQVGDSIAIEYEGERVGVKSGTRYKSFTVAVLNRQEQVAAPVAAEAQAPVTMKSFTPPTAAPKFPSITPPPKFA